MHLQHTEVSESAYRISKLQQNLNQLLTELTKLAYERGARLRGLGAGVLVCFEVGETCCHADMLLTGHSPSTSW